MAGARQGLRAWLCAAAAGLALLAASGRAGAQYIANEMPAEVRGLEITTKLGTRLPLDLKFTTSTGKEVALDSLFHKGRPVVLAMMYFRCPLLCPKVREEILQALNGIDYTVGSEFDVVFVSFDPRDGTSDVEKARIDTLMAYERLTTDPVRQGWIFLRGEAESSRALADAIGFPYRYLPESGEYSHPTALFILTPEGVISRCYTMLPFESKDVRLALLEASSGKIGTLLDRFTLWCYHPTSTGKFLISPMRVMQVCAGLCAAAVLVFVGVMAAKDAIRRRGTPRRAARAGTPEPGMDGTTAGALGAAGFGKTMGHAR